MIGFPEVVIGWIMTRDEEQATKAGAPRAETSTGAVRKRRLAAALRENLRRRKAQTQARARQASEPSSDEED